MYGHVIRQWSEYIADGEFRRAAHSIARDVHRGLYFIFFSQRLESLLEGGTNHIETICVDPHKVRWNATAPRSMLPRYGDDAVVGVLGGDWDRFREPVTATETYRKLKTAYLDDTGHELLTSMQSGYRGIDSYDGDTRRLRGVDVPDEIRLAVGRDGELMRWSGGLHRLSAAQLLDIDRIPAYVVVWHAHVDRERVIADCGCGSDDS